ncbi:hypothetical protein RISK_003317 [Rhodopirellula islandica]|uniref:Uncharacterized protein n=1 Tax=Rhodopirellula islandica TaxID=595434 RepID=A0A0J1BDT2_RHOIS|nr:hypothetical protein RISK_003317 [Rhodopirellula islandica]
MREKPSRPIGRAILHRAFSWGRFIAPTCLCVHLAFLTGQSSRVEHSLAPLQSGDSIGLFGWTFE